MFSRSTSLLLGIAAAFLLSACDSGSSGPGAATAVAIVVTAGNGQTGTVGSSISGLQIEARDDRGNPVGGVPFTVSVQSGGGAFTAAASVTVKGATAIGTWTLGTTAGPQSLSVTSGTLPAVTITATAAAAAAAVVEPGGGGGTATTTAGGAGSTSPLTPSIRVKDAFGNAVAGRNVSAAITGGGTLANASPMTDASGLASVGTWTLGGQLGEQTVTLTVAGLAPVTFTATVTAGPPSQIAAVTPPPASLPAGSAVTTLEFTAQDQFGNPVSGQTVSFTVAEGGGAVTNATANTDAQGRASPGTWTLGTTAGLNRLRAAIGTVEVIVSVTGAPGTPAALVVAAGSGQTGPVGTALPTPPLFVLRDAFGNGIAGQTVQFTVLTGGGTLAQASAVTAAGGTVSPGTWTLGGAAGAQTIQAQAGALTVTLSATATAGPPAVIVVTAGAGQTAPVGATLPVAPVFALHDAFGNGIAGQAMQFTVVTGGGALALPSAVTGANGAASPGVWTLGGLLGTQTIQAQVGTLTVTLNATATAAAPASIIVTAGAGQTGPVGSALPVAPVFTVRDAFGHGLSGQTVQFTVLAGGGTLTQASAVTNESGAASPGTWTLGGVVGTQTIRAQVGALLVTLDATATAGPPAVIVVTAGTGQSGPVGSPLPVAPVFALRDAFGNGIAGQTMNFTVTAGGGAVAVPSAVTGAGGTASPGTWTLGASVGTQSIQAQVGGLTASVNATATGGGGGGGYNVDIRVVGPAPSAGVAAALAAAKARLEQVVLGDLPNVGMFGIDVAADCNMPGAPILNEVIDDLVVFVQIGPQDGPLAGLARAGPCYIRSLSLLPVVGVMFIDEADIAFMESNAILAPVILHELLHVLGIGTLWSDFGLLTGAGSPDPIFTGSPARAAFLAAGGTSPAGVPVENVGGLGTRDAHWRTSILDTELMTGFVSPVMPFSAISIQSLLSFGYTVDVSVADPYTVPGAAIRLPRLIDYRLGNDVLPVRFTIDQTGRVRNVLPNPTPPPR